MTTGNKVFRIITLCLQIIALAAYFGTPLVIGGRVGTAWLAIGVVHAAAFCAVFFRNSRRRFALSVVLTIIVMYWSMFFPALGFLLGLGWIAISALIPLAVYGLCSLLAAIFALVGPRKYWRTRQWAPSREPPNPQ
jgi:hypothetical protein